MSLTTCVHCARHVRVTETRCPFCEGDLGARAPSVLARGVRAAVVVGLLVGTGVALSACYGSPTPCCFEQDFGPEDASQDAAEDATAAPTDGATVD